jgi:hypothetical protein
MQRRDANLTVERVPSLYTVKNYTGLYSGDTVKLKKRKGYTRFNSTALVATATQLFWFKDLDENEHLLGILDDNLTNGQWYKIAESGAHTRIDTQIATARQPIVQVGNRVFFGTDEGGATSTFMWADDTSIGAGTSYRVGIARPGFGTYVSTGTDVGHSPTATNLVTMNETSQRKFAIQYDVSSEDVTVSTIKISVAMEDNASKGAEVPGAWTCAIYTDNGGEPSTTRVHEQAISTPVSVYTFDLEPNPDFKDFVFKTDIALSANTTYWFVVSGDADYYNNYEPTNPPLFNGKVGTEGTAPGHDYGPLLVQDFATSVWSAEPAGREPVFTLADIDSTKAYGHVLTYYSTDYGIESRPCDEVRTTISSGDNYVIATPISSIADRVRIYRREMDDITDEEDDITDVYKFVGEVNDGDSLIDMAATERLGAELQTQDHYLFDETDDGDDAVRPTALVPFVITYWKGRIIFAEENSNIIHFSKRLEKDGATGQTGQEVLDYFPLRNFQEIPHPSSIIALKPLGNDQLAVYFKDEAVWIIRGMNDVLNPPSDISRYPMLSNIGLIAPAGLDNLKERHVYLSSDGVYIFNGTVNPEHASNVINSIFNAIESKYLVESVIAVNANEVWVLVDSDNDGSLDAFYILDIQQPEMPWRYYDYGTTFYDVVLRRTGATFRTLLAADAESNYILQLDDGTDDNGLAIESEAETHDIEVGGEIAGGSIALRGYYPSNPPSYEIIVTDHLGEEYLYSLSPSSSDDIRRHIAGFRVLSASRLRVKIKSSSKQEDELHSIVIDYEKR